MKLLNSSIALSLLFFLLNPPWPACHSARSKISRDASSQQTFHPPNAFLEFRCPAYAIPFEPTLSVTGEVVLPRTFPRETGKSISYRWSVEGGNLIDGQGTSRITIRPAEAHTRSSQSIRITVEPDNAPPEVEIRKSCVIKVDATCRLQQLDEFAAISGEAEHKRLDRLVTEVLRPNQNTFLYVIAYGGKKSCIQEATWRLRRIKTYLAERHNVDPARILMVDGGFRNEFSVGIFTSTIRDCGPLPTPNVLTGEVEIEGRCEDKQ